jgi:DHA3 family tetracycline resistance protein-like MFS transporter
VRVALPIALGGGLFVLLGLVLALVMPETGFAPVPRSERTTWQTLFGTLREGLRLVRGRPVLLTILAISAVVGLHSEGLDRLWTPHLLDNFTFPAGDQFEPVMWFGFIGAVSSVLAVGVTELVRRRLDTTHQANIVRVQAALMGVIITGIMVFALAHSFWLAVGALWMTQAARSVGYPIFSAWLNQHVDSSVRATMFSVSGQLNAIGQIAGGPGVGYIGTAGSLRLALMTSALLLSPALVLLARVLRRIDPAERAITQREIR